MRILVVEDEVKLAHAIKKGLEQEGFAVDIALNGDDGLAMAEEGVYDAILLDRMIPGEVDGVGIARLLRQRESSTPILMVTAKDTVNDVVEGLEQGADDYLIKPFAFAELVARLRALLRRPAHMHSELLQCADLALDTNSKQVRRSNKLISLTVKEFALLEYLMRHQNIVLSKEALIEHVWDFDADILPNTVEVYIGYLRAKIDQPFQGPRLIHTKRGFGYYIGVKS
ncbi:response regulator transcription factor [Candidatus Saccharibacteria bacterium]|nr:response regulator transcription factor [Candidatus Saccharibacteria bacterium]